MDALPELTAGPPSLAIEYVDPLGGDGRLRVAVRRKR